MPTNNIGIEIENRIAIVIMTGDVIDEYVASDLRDICESLRQDDEVWAVVLTGSGDTFCTGTDLSSLEEADSPTEVLASLKVSTSIASIEKPVIAVLNGDALNQGLEIALACDIRIVSDNATFGLTQIKDGLIPWDGGTQRLPRLIGRSRATEIILTSRIVKADEALEIGLVNQIVSSDEILPRAKEIASIITKHGPIAARYLKETVVKGMDMTLEQGLGLEADLNFILQSTTDRAEGISSFLERRTPEYQGE